MNLRETTVNSVKWSAIGDYTNTIFSFFLGIVLARILSPSDYGTVGMIGIFFAVSGVFVDSGLGSALIRKKDADEKDFSTVFYFNLVVSCFCYFLLFLSSPWIASFFEMPILKDLVRVSGLTLIIGSLGSIHYTILTRNLDFKKPAIIRILANIISGILAIVLAYKGWGIWTLVFQSVSSSIISVICVLFITSWKPRLIFSRSSFHELFGFGSKILLNGLSSVIYTNIARLLIGKFYTPQALGLYTKGASVSSLPFKSFFGVIEKVTYPIMTKIQDDDTQLIRVYSKYIRTLSIPIIFFMALLFAIAKPLVIFLYTEKWIGAVIYIQIFCFYYMFAHISKVNISLLLVKGRSDLTLKIEIINRIMQICVLAIAIPFGPVVLCVLDVFAMQFKLVLNSYYTGKLFDYGYKEQVKDFIPYFIISLICCTPAFLLTFIEMPYLLCLISGSIISIVLYIGLLLIRKDNNLVDLIRLTPLKKYIPIDC